MFRNKHLTTFLLALALAIPSSVTLCLGSGDEGRPPAKVFDGIRHKDFTASYEQLEELATYATARRNNAFEFLRDVALHLDKEKSSARILGQDLQRISKKFSLGDTVVNAILPVQNVLEITVGYLGEGTQSAGIRVELDRPGVTSQFTFILFTVTLHFEKSYGINLVSQNYLGSIYGVGAERLGSTAQVLGVNLIRNTKIGVELNPGPSPSLTIAPVQKKRGSTK